MVLLEQRVEARVLIAANKPCKVLRAALEYAVVEKNLKLASTKDLERRAAALLEVD